MKTIALLIIVIITTLSAAPKADAGQQYGYRCTPAYLCTKEICRRTECHYAYNHCGQRYAYHIIVITYADYYSNNTRRTYTRCYRS